MLFRSVYAATAADIDTVVCDGKVVVSGGAHRHLDVGRELARSIAQVFGEKPGFGSESQQ